MNNKKLAMQAMRSYYCLDAVRDDLWGMIMELNRDRSAQMHNPATGTREAAETAQWLRDAQSVRRDVTDAMQILARLMRQPGSLPGEDDE